MSSCCHRRRPRYSKVSADFHTSFEAAAAASRAGSSDDDSCEFGGSEEMLLPDGSRSDYFRPLKDRHRHLS